MRCSPIAVLTMSAAITVLSAPGCRNHRAAAVATSVQEANKSLAELRTKVGVLQKSTADLHARFNRLPEDLPGLEMVRSKLFALDEVMGIAGAKVNWMADNLNKAAATGNSEEIRQISDTINSSVAGCEGIGKTVVGTMHELLPYERLAAQRGTLGDGGR